MLAHINKVQRIKVLNAVQGMLSKGGSIEKVILEQ